MLIGPQAYSDLLTAYATVSGFKYVLFSFSAHHPVLLVAYLICVLCANLHLLNVTNPEEKETELCVSVCLSAPCPAAWVALSFHLHV